jgi:hypothetical protein
MKNLEEWANDQNWDSGELPSGHRDRFMAKLKAACEEPPVSDIAEPKATGGRVVQLNTLFKYAAVAVIAVLLGVSGMKIYSSNMQQESGLASISPEMAQAEDFFTSTIDRELAQLDQELSPETERIINDTKVILKKLEKEYQEILRDFNANEDSQAVIAAMIENFQSRIGLLEEAQQQIKQLKKLKEEQDEDVI